MTSKKGQKGGAKKAAGKSAKKAGSKKSGATRAGLKASAAGSQNGKSRRFFIQLDVTPELRGGVDTAIQSRGFAANKISVSDIGRLLFKAFSRGVQVHITDVASYYAAQAALSQES